MCQSCAEPSSALLFVNCSVVQSGGVPPLPNIDSLWLSLLQSFTKSHHKIGSSPNPASGPTRMANMAVPEGLFPMNTLISIACMINVHRSNKTIARPWKKIPRVLPSFHQPRTTCSYLTILPIWGCRWILLASALCDASREYYAGIGITGRRDK